jgi:hypothetical protein
LSYGPERAENVKKNPVGKASWLTGREVVARVAPFVLKKLQREIEGPEMRCVFRVVGQEQACLGSNATGS